MVLSLSPAAVCQCFSLVSLCTSIADPNWIEVRNDSDPNSRLIYGVSFALHPQQNLTDTDPLGGTHSWGLWLLRALAVVCYATVLLSGASFIFDFLGSAGTWPHLSSLLHSCTAVLCMVVLGICGTCLYVVSLNLQKQRGHLFWDDAGGEAWTKGVRRALPGESFFIAGLALVFSFSASILSFCCVTETMSWRRYEPIETDDTNSESLSATEQEAGHQVPLSGQTGDQTW